MSEEGNKAIVRRFVEEVQTRHNLDALDELFSPAYVDNSGMASSNTLDSTKDFFTDLFTAFPDMKATIHDQVAENDKVVTRKTLSGTHQGQYMGVPPTGRQIDVDVIDIFRIEDGKIIEHWALADMLGAMQQLGAIPAQ
jgi:steroid delta-isomerase-like uncharacterized protein